MLEVVGMLRIERLEFLDEREIVREFVGGRARSDRLAVAHQRGAQRSVREEARHEELGLVGLEGLLRGGDRNGGQLVGQPSGQTRAQVAVALGVVKRCMQGLVVGCDFVAQECAWKGVEAWKPSREEVAGGEQRLVRGGVFAAQRAVELPRGVLQLCRGFLEL